MTIGEGPNDRRFFSSKSPKVRAFFVGATLMAAAHAQAWSEELSLLVNGWSHHFQVPTGVQYNERNFGIGLQFDFNRIADHWVPFITASGFEDSTYNVSYYAGGGIMRRFNIAPTLDNLYFDAGIVAFIMTRKNYHDNRPFVGLLPVATFGTEHFAVNIAYVPKVHPKVIPLVFFQLKIPLKKN